MSRSACNLKCSEVDISVIHKLWSAVLIKTVGCRIDSIEKKINLLQIIRKIKLAHHGVELVHQKIQKVYS